MLQSPKRCFQRSSERIEGKSRLPQSGWEIVPQSRTGCRETPVAKFVVCSWHKQLTDVVGMRPQRTTISVRLKMAVISKIRGSSTSERLIHEPGDLECDSLTNWQPVHVSNVAQQSELQSHVTIICTISILPQSCNPIQALYKAVDVNAHAACISLLLLLLITMWRLSSTHLFTDVVTGDANEVQYCVHVPRVVRCILLGQNCNFQHLEQKIAMSKAPYTLRTHVHRPLTRVV